jgi:hypothetical protein
VAIGAVALEIWYVVDGAAEYGDVSMLAPVGTAYADEYGATSTLPTAGIATP